MTKLDYSNKKKDRKTSRVISGKHIKINAMSTMTQIKKLRNVHIAIRCHRQETNMSHNHFHFISRARFDELVGNYLNNMLLNRNQAIKILSGDDTSVNQRYKHRVLQMFSIRILTNIDEVKILLLKSNMSYTSRFTTCQLQKDIRDNTVALSES